MPNPNQVGNSDPNQNTENGFTKMANEMPSYEDHIAQYKAEHPNAVEDIEKARAMAEAGNSLETAAAEEKLNALEALSHGEEIYTTGNPAGAITGTVAQEDGLYVKKLQDAPQIIKEYKELASSTEEHTGEIYDKIKNS